MSRISTYYVHYKRTMYNRDSPHDTFYYSKSDFYTTKNDAEIAIKENNWNGEIVKSILWKVTVASEIYYSEFVPVKVK